MGKVRSHRKLECGKAVSKPGRSFYLASQLLGGRHSLRSTRLYAFCRHIDDTVDTADNKAAAGRALDLIELELAGRAVASEQTRDFLELARETGMPLAPVLLLIGSVRSDLGVVALKTEEDLLRYAYGVAGVVGVMMCYVLDVHAPEARPFAIDLGIGMQLTNIARDVEEDAQLGRRYLPESWVGPATPDQLLHPDTDMKLKLRQAEAKILSLAEAYYASADRGMGYLPGRARFAILVAGRLYRQIGRGITRRSFEAWSGRVRISGVEKIAVVSCAAMAFIVNRDLHLRSHVHNPRLHQPFEELPFANTSSAT